MKNKEKIYTPRLSFMCSVLLLVPASFASADMHSLTAGLSISYDYDKRQYEEEDRGDDVYQQISISPLILYEYSPNSFDIYSARIEPSVRYDLEESETEWDYNDLLVTFQKTLTKHWTVDGSNSYLRSDSQESERESSTFETSEQEVSETRDSQTVGPELSDDPGRNRYWSNNLQLGTDYTYKEQSLVHLGFGYSVLRNDSANDNYVEYEDYDRYVFNVSNEHQYSIAWITIIDLSYILGEYDEIGTQAEEGADITVDNLSNDLKEYRFSATLENHSFRQDIFSLDYEYIGSKYEEELQNDSDIHQGRLTWRRQYSPQLSTTLGAGPSYEKTEGHDANYGGNGFANIRYRMRNSLISFELEKDYDVENFSGTEERGSVDIWVARLFGNYRLTRNLTIDGRLSYANETREEPIAVTVDAAETDGAVTIEEYTQERSEAGLGLSYNFLRYYTASMNYSYAIQQADRSEDEYDDHRILLTLSWNQEVLRW